MAVMALLPYAVLAATLAQLPGSWTGPRPMAWPSAAAGAGLLLALMAAHAWSYARWTQVAPNRMLVNEFVARAWFVLFGLLAVGLHADTGPLFLLMASALAVASWCVHYLVLRRQGCYRILENIGLLGLFLLGLALIGLLSLRI